ncbi:General secretion pathway protein D / Type II secretion outermembrane pore forming protein (PulD) [hydrothermal vent metagenome]|uniref:General secretion pathway protein D / Type II secretion outermembrane pore forming protein (PulD) n=1 Tax=hydrothermal vent metagenome TaxID=652676 RepID=A0A1W1CY51_9ZZZZ
MKFIKVTVLIVALSMTLFAREQVNVSFSDLAINDFIKLISKVTHKNILINNRINGKVNFVSTTPIYDDELMGILISVLESKGYTLVQDGSIYQVVRSSEAAKHNVKVVSSHKNPSGSLMVTQTIKIHNENVDVVAAKIRYLISKTAKLMTMRESNTILITDYPKNIETIKEVIRSLEVKKEQVVEIYPLQNTEAKKLQSKINVVARTIFNTKVVSENVKILVDENINGIILVGEKKNVDKLVKLIKKLDVESSVNKSVQIFELKNSDAKAVLKTLNSIVSKQKYSDPSLKPSLSASDEINAIIVVGDPVIIKGIKLIIDELDKEKYQVYVQARIIEINKENAANLGVRYGFDGAATSAEGLYSLSANFGGAPIQGIVGNALASSIVGSGAAQGFALGAAIDFLETNGASKSISNPSILCVNNKASSIYVGKTISVSTGAVTSTNGTSGVTNSYKREDVGLTLTIKPRVSSNEKVNLDVKVVLENILDDGSKNATGQPVTSKQDVKTQAILRHGESIIIGGLVKNYERNSVSKVPLLGDIPLIGSWLFSSKSKTQEQDNLVVVLTPYVIDKSEKLSKLQKDLGLLSKLQKRYDKEVFARMKEKEKKEEVKSDVTP